ncbi:hypothetical protein [Bacillus sp. Hm123]|uniref:hypothetical protein n=1 Tax=Bacillus sp. Hm123 TaxID=3450745 RepID=UPI003F43EC3D
MEFAEMLAEKRNNKAIDEAQTFIEKIKPKLVEAAEKGYAGFNYKIDENTEKDKITIYKNQVFIDYLNEKLGGVDCNFETRFTENLVFKGRGWNTYFLTFTWSIVAE